MVGESMRAVQAWDAPGCRAGRGPADRTTGKLRERRARAPEGDTRTAHVRRRSNTPDGGMATVA